MHVLLEYAGKEATSAFYSLHRQSVLSKYGRLVVGSIQGETPQIEPQTPGSLSKVPFAEPMWLLPQYKSPYFNDSHRRFQKEMRLFVDTYITEEAQRSEMTGEKPTEALLKRLCDTNLTAMRLGPGKHLEGLELFAGIKPQEFDYFHELILNQEIARIGARGFVDGMQGGIVIGLPPVINFGLPELKKRVVPQVFRGEKKACLAVSEAFAGSDVAGIKTTSVKTADGKHFLVNGTKKWITGGYCF